MTSLKKILIQSLVSQSTALLVAFVMLGNDHTAFAQDMEPTPEESSEVVNGTLEAPPESPTEDLPVEGSNPVTPEPAEAEVLGMELPAISAKAYDLKVVRPSLSKRMYLFNKATNGMPDIGRVFLLRESTSPVMGFRVVKVYPDKGEIAAKKIKDYPGYSELTTDAVFKAYEKVGLITNIPENTPDDITDLNELEGGAAPAEGTDSSSSGVEGELDLNSTEGGADGVSPQAMNGGLGSSADTFSGESEIEVADGDDDDGADFESNMLGFDVGSFRGINLPGGSTSTGFALTYSKLLFESRAGGLAAELGVGYYKSNGDVVPFEEEVPVSQSFTMTPVAGRIKYHLSLSDKWSYYLYGGLLYNRVSSQIGATEDDVILAQTVVIGVGGGVYIPTGPNWYVRLNLGSDWMGLGLALRF